MLIGIDAWTHKGWALQELKKYDEAIECWNKSIQIDDNNNHVNEWNKDTQIIIHHNLKGRPEITIFNRIFAEKLITKGTAYNFLGKYEQAIEYYNKALEIDPKNGMIWTKKGVALNNLGRYDEAIECCNKALEIDDKHADAWINRSAALIRLGKYEEAIECCNRILEKDANYALAWYNRACAKVRNGQIESGINDLEKAVEIGKDYYVEMAKKDSDFESIRDEERFKAVLSKNTL